MLRATEGSPASSLSLDDQMSDAGDPLHDESILNELFYRVSLASARSFHTKLPPILTRNSQQNASDHSDFDLDLLAADMATTATRSVTSHGTRSRRNQSGRHYAASLEDSGNVVR